LLERKQATAKLGRGTPPAPPSVRTFVAAIAPETAPARPSTRTQSRRHYGDPLAGAPRVGDGRLVPAGLLARGSKRITPAFPPIGFGSGTRERRSPLTVAGAAAALSSKTLAPRSLFTATVRLGPQRDRHAGAIEATPSTTVNCLRRRRMFCACLLANQQRRCARLFDGVLDDTVEQRVDGCQSFF
jgi:hypothetical protein